MTENYKIRLDNSIILTISDRILGTLARPTLMYKITDLESFKMSLQNKITLHNNSKTTSHFEEETSLNFYKLWLMIVRKELHM